jgi:uncharacterized protein (TIGR02598 family)
MAMTKWLKTGVRHSTLQRGLAGVRAGFSLIEVVVAVGLCTFALSILAGLLPLGLGVVQNATEQIVETEIFDNIWSQANNELYSDLGTSNDPLFYSSSGTGAGPALYFDLDGNEIDTTGTAGAAPAGAVYIVRCSLVNSQLTATLNTTSPPLDFSNGSGACLTLAKIQIGYHIDPSTDTVSPDSRVAARSFLLVKRDGVPPQESLSQ